MSLLLFRLALWVGTLSLASSEEVTIAGIILMQQHGTIVYPHEDDEDHHQQCQQGIEVIGNRLYEDADAVLILYESRHCCSPR